MHSSSVLNLHCSCIAQHCGAYNVSMVWYSPPKAWHTAVIRATVKASMCVLMIGSRPRKEKKKEKKRRRGTVTLYKAI